MNDAPTATNLTQSLTLAEDAAPPDTPVHDGAGGVGHRQHQRDGDADAANTAAGVLVGAGTPVGAVYTITGTPAAVSAALAAVTFDSAQDFNGTLSVAVAVTDGQSGPQGSNPTGTVSITVTEVNDVPVATGETLSAIGEDSGARTIAFSALLANDTPARPTRAGRR